MCLLLLVLTTPIVSYDSRPYGSLALLFEPFWVEI